MKKISFLLLFISLFSYSQNYSAYQSAQPIQSNVSENLKHTAEVQAYNRKVNEANRARTSESFALAKANAIKAFNTKNYDSCIYFYEGSKDLGWYDAEFEFIAGVSYYLIYKNLNKKKYFKKAKKLLKKSQKHGFIKAEIFLDKNF